MLPPDMSDIKQNTKNLRCAVADCSYNTTSWACCTYLNVWISYAARVLVLFVLNKLKFCLCIT